MSNTVGSFQVAYDSFRVIDYKGLNELHVVSHELDMTIFALVKNEKGTVLVLNTRDVLEYGGSYKQEDCGRWVHRDRQGAGVFATEETDLTEYEAIREFTVNLVAREAI